MLSTTPFAAVPFAKDACELLPEEDPDGLASFLVPFAAGAFTLGPAVPDEAAAGVAGVVALLGATFSAPLAAGAGFFSSSFSVVYPKADDSQSAMALCRIHPSPRRRHPTKPSPDPPSDPRQGLNAAPH